jgi:hypothetical protein
LSEIVPLEELFFRTKIGQQRNSNFSPKSFPGGIPQSVQKRIVLDSQINVNLINQIFK